MFLRSGRDYELSREKIELGEIIGQGQFGDVHKGVYKLRPDNSVPVAIKTCKVDADLATAERFLEEACEYIKMLSLLFVLNKIWTHQP